MADWIWTESAGATLEEEPRLRSARFGDGYEQRAADGINNRPQSWVIPFDGVDDAVADEMIAFLRAQDGRLAFNYVPLRGTTALRVICRKWSRSHTRPGESAIRATFEQVFEP